MKDPVYPFFLLEFINANNSKLLKYGNELMNGKESNECKDNSFLRILTGFCNTT